MTCMELNKQNMISGFVQEINADPFGFLMMSQIQVSFNFHKVRDIQKVQIKYTIYIASNILINFVEVAHGYKSY